ncbi:MAG: polyphosphate kinase 1, partial [Novosphingobium sp.]|nr:polyphosphate kinase 1 [Novosphingobium sp.]
MTAAPGALKAERAVPAPGAPAERYFNRELSWLAFNQRVLGEARNTDYPLLERLRFLSISGSNLDEFLTVRVAGIAGQVRAGIEEFSIDGLSPSQQLTVVHEAVLELQRAQQEVWEDLRGALHAAGIAMADDMKLDAAQQRWLRGHFEDHIVPIITPQAIDPAHPFPFVASQGIGIMFALTRLGDGAEVMEMVLIPAALPRFIRLPGKEAIYIAIEDLLCRHADVLFPGFRVRGRGVFRVLRDSDIEVEEDAEDLVRYFRTAIQRRRRGKVIVLQLHGEFDPAAEQLLREQLTLDFALVIKTGGLIGIAGLATIVDEDRPELKFPPFNPRYPERILEHDGDCFAAIREKDIVIQHPYESFEVVVDFLRQAAADPDVVAIKQTLYRAGKQSAVIAALIAAAEAGKSVTAVVELKARFDEEQNLLWAAQLERAGVQVIYGFVDWKTHAKVSIVVRREEGQYRTYCHFGTGNYHPVTARIYTDLSYFTADPRMGRDAGRLFNFITGYVEPRRTELIAVSPLGLRERLYECIDGEIARAETGRPAAIWAKLNALTDPDL